MRWVAVSVTLDAKALPGHNAASSFPTKQPKGIAHVGHPVPTYSTVLFRVTPHVVMVSVPPKVASPPSDSEYTSRAPGKKVLNPALHEPEVYMPLLPDVSVDSCGAVPLAPTRGNVLGMPRHMGGDGVVDTVAVGVRVMDVLPVAVRVIEALLVAVQDTEPVPEAERVPDGLPVPVRVPDTDAVDERVCELDGVPVRVAEMLAVDVRD